MRVHDIFSSVLGTIKVDAEGERDDLLIYPQAIPEGSFCLSVFPSWHDYGWDFPDGAHCSIWGSCALKFLSQVQVQVELKAGLSSHTT
jgi:hypothetical protein